MIGVQIALTGIVLFLTFCFIYNVLELKHWSVALTGLLAVAAIPVGFLISIWMV